MIKWRDIQVRGEILLKDVSPGKKFNRTLFIQTKTLYDSHAVQDHPDNMPEDLQIDIPVSAGSIESLDDIYSVTVRFIFHNV